MKSSLMKLSDMVILNGEEYKINTDFRVWIEIEGLLLDNDSEPWGRLAKILTLAYPLLPQNPYDAVKGIMWFYSGGQGKSHSQSDGNEELTIYYDLAEDFDYIWGGFMSQYGIDLTLCQMHWWKFKALLSCLDDECKFMKIVAYRRMNTSAIKDKELRRFYERMKKQFRLKRALTEASGEELAANALAGLF